ncbi:MAG: DNA repair protein RecN [Desulfobulbaceae bacterium]|nr:DNA repair protein RecN [Desulfobulbaceae bacterium]
MLKELRIQNLALIESLHIELGDDLTVLTGETGAGKSIILQAIHLLSGGKASASWVRSGTESAEVEALFEISNHRGNLPEMIREMGFATDDGELLLKRSVSIAGKSRFYINGSLATAKVTSDIAENLLSVASQHDHQQLLSPRRHLDVVDTVGNLWPQRQELAELHGQWTSLSREYEELRAQEQDKEQRRDFLTYQCHEINEANLAADEEETLLQDKDRLKAADTLISLGKESHQLLAESISDKMGRVRQNLEKMASHDQSLTELSEAIAGHAYELEDKASDLLRYLDNLDNDPASLDKVAARIDLLQQLKRKYGETVSEVIAYGERARQELAELDNLDDQLSTLADKSRKAGEKLQLIANELSAARHKVAGNLEKAIGNELQSLNFEQANLKIQFNNNEPGDLNNINTTGYDRLEFMFSANPGEPVKPLAKIASGGELSRLMLALKCLLAKKDHVETVIFDEVDAGISGKAAEAVAHKIKELGAHHQVICITHLPPIAASATQHFTVCKSVTDGRTRTSITLLDETQRITELAKMLAGNSITEKTMAFAKEMIDSGTQK